jgi:hypothetical protein
MRALLFRLFRIFKMAVPAVYLVGAVFVWLDFARTNPDGLANIGIVLYTLPVALFGIFVLKGEFPFAPGGYYEAHAIYFLVSAGILALILFATCLALEKLTRSRVPSNIPPCSAHGAQGTPR